MPRAPVDPEALLSHAAFLRGLAGHLVLGFDRADDVVQDTWLAAIEHPPEPRGGIGGWLARVAKNAAGMRRRGDARRDRRERAVARPDLAPSAAEVLEREAARRRVVEAVLALDEPYRETVLLRYFEDLPPREVARRQGVPVETVRTRTKRAIERLRVALDERHGGDRRAWAGALVSLLPRGAASVAAGAGGFALARWAALALATAAGVVLLWRPWAEPAAEDEPDAVAVAGRGAPADPGLAVRGDGPSRASLDAGSTALTSRAGRPIGTLRGFVVRADRATAVAGAKVVARATTGVLPDGMGIDPLPAAERATTTDEQGTFVLEGLPLGAYALSATKEGEGTGTGTGCSAVDGPWGDVVLAEAVRGDGKFALQVVDAQGAPVAAARVAWDPGGGSSIVATTGTDGTVRLPLVPRPSSYSQGRVSVTSARGIGTARLYFEPRGGGSDVWRQVRVEPAGSVAGRVSAPPGTDLAALVVRLYTGHSAYGEAAHEARVAADGAYLVEGVAVGTYLVVVPSVRGLRLDVARKPLWDTSPEPADYAMPTAVVTAGARATCDVALVAGGTLRGRVVRGDTGAPAAGVRVRVLLPAGPGDYSERVRYHDVNLWRFDGPRPDDTQDAVRFRLLATDADGRYEATGLFPSKEYRVSVFPAPSLSFEIVDPVVVEDGRVAELSHRVVPAGALELVTDSGCLAIRPVGTERPVAVFVTPQSPLGACTIPGLAAGSWEVVTGYPGRPTSLRRVAAFEVVAGRTTLVDAASAHEERIVGRVTRGGVPVAGAFVLSQVSQPWRRTDAEGRFSIPAFTANPSEAIFDVRAPEPEAVAARFSLGGRSRGMGGGSGGGAGRAASKAPAPETPADATIDADGYELALPTGAVRVVATRLDGAPAAGAEVRLSGGRTFAARTTDGNGVARWIGLPPGVHTMTATFPGSGARARTEVTVGVATSEVSLREPPSGEVRVVVRDEAGRPVAGARVAAYVVVGLEPGATPSDDAWKTAVRLDDPLMLAGPDGVALLRGVPHGRVRVTAGSYPGGSSGWGPPSETGHAEVHLGGDGGTTAEVRLAPPQVAKPSMDLDPR